MWMVASPRPPLARLIVVIAMRRTSGAWRIRHSGLKTLASVMSKSVLGALVAVMMIVPGAQAEERKGLVVDLPVFAADGIKIGRVFDVSMTDGRIEQIRVSTSLPFSQQPS